MSGSQIPNIRPFIDNDRSAVRNYVVFSLALFFLGITIIGLTFLPYFKETTEVRDIASKIAGSFISSLSAFPIKELFTRRDRLRILQELQTMISSLDFNTPQYEDDIKRFNDLVWEMYKKGATG
jgi:hypothetical protein